VPNGVIAPAMHVQIRVGRSWRAQSSEEKRRNVLRHFSRKLG
jgi:hypothetical protein